MNEIKYFAYGSNMALNRLRQRVPSARLVGIYALKNHELRFHKVGKDGSAKCDAFFTGSDVEAVKGVVFDIDPKDVIALDKAEGLGKGYKKKTIQVTNSAGHRLEAFTYVATNINDSMFPFFWYKHHVLVGAKSVGLPSGYIAKIENIKAIKDPDKAREKRELAVHEY